MHSGWIGSNSAFDTPVRQIMDISEIGRQFGLNEAQTRAAFEQLTPVVAAGIRRNNQTDNGLEGLLKALQAGGHSRYADDPSALQFDRVADDGNAILGHVFGSKDVSRNVANQAADLSGVGSAVLKKLLPVIAAIVMGQLAKRMGGGKQTVPQGGSGSSPGGSGQGGGLGDILGDILGGGKQTVPQGGSGSSPGGGGLGDILGDILGGGQSQGGASPNAPRPQSGTVSLDDLLREMMGGGQGGVNQDVADRSRKRIDDVLGGGTKTGNAADDLLNSVDRVTRRR
jgi:hypothetical protein